MFLYVRYRLFCCFEKPQSSTDTTCRHHNMPYDTTINTTTTCHAQHAQPEPGRVTSAVTMCVACMHAYVIGLGKWRPESERVDSGLKIKRTRTSFNGIRQVRISYVATTLYRLSLQHIKYCRGVTLLKVSIAKEDKSLYCCGCRYSINIYFSLTNSLYCSVCLRLFVPFVCDRHSCNMLQVVRWRLKCSSNYTSNYLKKMIVLHH